MKLKCFFISVVLFSLSLSQEKIPPTYMAAFGSVSINGKLYNHVSFKPEFTMGKVGLGLDIYFYFDEDGNVYDRDWDFSTPEASLKTIMDKIYYIRYGMPVDKTYFRIGTLPKRTMGHGILVNNYANDIDYPQTRRIGFDFRYTFSGFRLEFLHSNIKEFSHAGLFGLRTVFPLIPTIDMGFSVVTDLDQNFGLPDSDNDSYPDDWDDFPDDGTLWNEFQGEIHDLESNFNCTYDVDGNINDCPEHVATTISDYYTLWNADIAMNSLPKDDVSGVAIDLTYKINDKIKLFSEFAQLNGDTKNPYTDNTNFNTNLGFGFIPIALEVTFNSVVFTLDYRESSENFIFHYWDKNYEHNRSSVSMINDEKKVITKESLLYQFGKQKGGSIGFIANISKYLKFSVNYLYLKGDKWDSAEQMYVNDKNNSFYSKFEIDTSMIPKVEIAEIFYQQTNTKNPLKFKNNENTLFGYNIGVSLANNLSLILKGRKTYVYNSETEDYTPVKNTQIETSVYF